MSSDKLKRENVLTSTSSSSNSEKENEEEYLISQASVYSPLENNVVMIYNANPYVDDYETTIVQAFKENKKKKKKAVGPCSYWVYSRNLKDGTEEYMDMQSGDVTLIESKKKRTLFSLSDNFDLTEMNKCDDNELIPINNSLLNNKSSISSTSSMSMNNDICIQDNNTSSSSTTNLSEIIDDKLKSTKCDINNKLSDAIIFKRKITNDGYRWKKYGQKTVNRNMYIRGYYKCTYNGCKCRKKIDKSSNDDNLTVITYEGIHIHPPLNILNHL